MPKIVPCLWFDKVAEDAARFYVSVFPNSRIDRVSHSPTDNPSTRKGEVLEVEFTLDGQQFIGLNGGPDFTFDEAISFTVDCADQAEVDRYWEALTAGGGRPDVCGWLKDRYGLSWQIIPRQLPEMLNSDDREAAGRAMDAMLKMGKIEVDALREAFDGVPTPG